MRADSLAGQVVAVLSRRTPAFQTEAGDPVTFPGRVSRLLAGSEQTGGETWGGSASSPHRSGTYGEDILEIPPRRGRWSSEPMDLPRGSAGWSFPRGHLPEFGVVLLARRYRALLVTAAAAAVVITLAALLVAYPRSPGSTTSPTGLALGAETEDASGTAYTLEISWSSPVSGPQPDAYQILRNGAQAGTVSGSDTSFTVDGLTPDASYTFQVVAVRNGTASAASETITSQTPPLRPTGLTERNSTADSLQIAWSSPAAGPAPDNYEILRNGTKIATIPGAVTSYTDQGLAAGTAYSYQVVAITGSGRSRASAALPASTSKPSLSDAVLSYSGTVTEKMLSVTPAAPGWTFQLGQTKTDSWTMSPDCASGPCTVTLDGAYNGFTYSATLIRSGATYSGTTTLKDYFYCIKQTNTFSATLNISITVSNATTQGNAWTATAFTGHETVNAPAHAYAPTSQTCYATVGQLSVASGG